MRYINDNYEIVPLSILKSGSIIRERYKRCVAVTFDDAYNDFYENALPILEKYNIPSTVFIPTGYIGKYNEWDANLISTPKRSIMSKDRILESIKTGLVDVGSHSVDHVRMSRLNEKEMHRQAFESKNTLEKIVGFQIDMFAYPYGMLGDHSLQTTEVLRNVGYKIGVTCNWGTNSPNQDLLCLKRIRIMKDDSNNYIKFKIENILNIKSIKEHIAYIVRSFPFLHR